MNRPTDASCSSRLRNRIALELLEDRRLLSTAYFVNPFTGDNLAAGTLSAPWKTIDRVNGASFGPGDSVRFFTGTDGNGNSAAFAGNLTFGADDAGTSASPILVGSYDGATAGGQPVLSSTKAIINAGGSNALSAVNTAGLSISNLSLIGSGRATNTGSGVRFDNNLTGSVKLGHVYVDNVDIHGFGKYGVTIGGSGSSGKSGFSDIRLTNIDAYDNATGGIETHGVYSTSTTAYANAGLYIGHCRVHDNPGFANSSNHVGDGIVISDIDGATVERCVAWNNGALNTHVGGPVGIWAWDANAVTLQYNESHHNHTASTADGGGFDLDGGITNSVMQYNYSHDNDGAGYGVFQFKGARAFRNNTVRYNISENDGRKNNYAGIQFWSGAGARGISNVEVYHNTVFVSPSAGGNPRGIYFQNGTTNVHVRNNIIQTTGGVTIADVQGKQSGLLFQGNLYYASGSAFRIKQSSTVYSSLDAWRSSKGQEKVNGLSTGSVQNPQLTDPGAGGTIGNADQLSTLSAYRPLTRTPTTSASLNGATGGAINLWKTFSIDPGRFDFFGTALPGDLTTASTFRYDVGAAQYV